jgi:hypothetical protein
VAPKPKDIWGIPAPSAKDVVSFLNNAVNLGRTASGDKAAVTPGDAGVRTMGRGISLTNDYLNPYANTTKQLLGMAAGNEGAQEKFAKSLARDVVVTGAAVGLGAVAGKAINAAGKTSIAQRIGNAARGETVVIHGSPTPRINILEPRTAVQTKDMGPQLLGMRPTKDVPLDQVVEYTMPYGKKGLTSGSGQLYVAKVPTSKTNIPIPQASTEMSVVEKFKFENYGIKPDKRPNIKPYQESIIRSSAPGKVVSEVKIGDMSPQELTAVMKKELKAAGVKVEPNKVQKLLNKAEAAKMAKRQRIANQNSVV